MIQPTNTQQAYPQGGANAVSINIYNPQAYGSNPNATQQAPYDYSNSLYQMPQSSIYGQAPQAGFPQAGYYQQFLPMQAPIQQFPPMQAPMQQFPMQAPIQQFPQLQAPIQQFPMQAPIQQFPMQAPIQQFPQLQAPIQQIPLDQQGIPVQMPYTQPQQQIISAPAPQEMPASVIQPEVQEVAQTQPQQQVAPTEAPQVETTQAEQPAQVIDTNALVEGLKSTDADKRADAINQIAVYAQEAPETALQVVSEPIMNSLIDIIKEDTSKLEGPTDKQIEIAEKITKGQQLTPEEDALSEQLSPRDKANKNRIFALYTLAMVQKLQRDELNQYIETQKANGEQTIAPLNIGDLAGYNDITNIIQNDTRPEVKVAAIQALGYVAEPQDKAAVEQALAGPLSSNDEVVKNAAQEAVSKFSQSQDQQQTAQTV